MHMCTHVHVQVQAPRQRTSHLRMCMYMCRCRRPGSAPLISGCACTCAGAGAQAAHLSSPALAPLLGLLRPSSRALRRHRLLLLAEGTGYRGMADGTGYRAVTGEDAGSKAAANKAAMNDEAGAAHGPLNGRRSAKATLGAEPAMMMAEGTGYRPPREGPRCRIAALGLVLDHSRAACNASQRCAQKAAAYQLQSTLHQHRPKMG